MARRRRQIDFGSAARPFREATRWIFLGTLVYAPWAYGTTTSQTIVAFDYLLGAVVTLWLGDLLIRRRLPEVPMKVLVAVGLLLLIGWGMAANARSIYDPDFRVFMALRPAATALPGSYDQVNSLAWMTRGTVLLLALCLVADLVQRPAWLLRLWYAIAAAGGSIAMLGLLQKGSGARMIFWGEWELPDPPSFFATYFYHANAGAYLNLVLPATVGLAARSVASGERPAVRALWLTAAISVTVAVFANTSRAAQIIGIALMIAIAAFSFRKLRRVAARAEKLPLAVGIGVAVLALFAVAQASRLDQPLKRWGQLSESLPNDERWTAAFTAWPVAREAGWFGFGPGTFRSIFPHYVDAPGSVVHGVWRFLHQDYLQTLIEWGWLGSALWTFLFFGGIAVAIRAFRATGDRWLPRQRLLLPLVLLALASVALHALVDFPLQIASIELYVATYLGICWGSGGWEGEGKGKGERGKAKVESRK